MAVVSEAVALPRLALIKLWEWEGFGQPHPVVGGDDYWMSPEAAGRLEGAVYAELEERELASGGHLAPEFRDTLRVLAYGSERYFGWISDLEAGTTGGALVAALGDDAVRLVRDGDYIGLERIYPDQLAEYLVDSLPYLEPAAIDPITAPRSAMPRPGGADDDYEVEVTASSRGPSPAARLKKLLRARRSGVHQLYAGRLPGTGAAVNSRPLTAIDLAGEGRILTYVDFPPDEEPQVSCVPGDWDTLVGALLSAYGELR